MIKKAHITFLATLANMNRLMIIDELRRKDLNVGEISSSTSLNQTTVSHNLKRLLICGFVTVHKEGKYRYYSLNQETISPLMEIIDVHVIKHCRNIRKEIKLWR